MTDPEFDYNVESARDFVDQSAPFGDNKVIQLQMNDPIIYFNEINTQLLTENFEIEVFEVIEWESCRVRIVQRYRESILKEKYLKLKMVSW